MKTRNSSGFTLVEIMVAMVVLAVGLLGMAAMTVMVMRGSKGASDLTAATNICQLKIEELKDVDFTDLGSLDSSGAPEADLIQWGAFDGKMIQERDLNAQGRDSNVSDAEGPFKFVRTFVICRSIDYEDAPPDHDNDSEVYIAATPSSNETRAAPDCRVDPANVDSRVEALTCMPGDIALGYGSDSEKKIKVLCSWTDRTGACHSVHLDTTVVNLN